MLKSVQAVLKDLNLVGPAEPLHHYVNITAGDCMALSLVVGERTFLQVKVSEYLDLRAEFERCRRAWLRFPRFVPRPLGHASRDGWSIMVSEGVRHTPLRARSLLCPSHMRRQITDELHGFFAVAGSPEANEVVAREASCRLALVEEAFAGTPQARLAERWLEYGRRHGIDALVRCSQHGDFVLNNLAWTGSHLVIFDWEDFGKIDVVGLDLATLLLSLTGDDGVLLRGLMSSESRGPNLLGEFMRTSCAAYGLDCEQFKALLPVYLLLFLHLKRNYGVAVRERIGAMLDRLSMP